MKNGFKLAGVILLVLASPFIFMFIIDAGIIIIGTTAAEIMHQKEHRAVFSYVLENNAALPRCGNGYQSNIIYSEFNSIGVTVEFGYYYSENDTYESVSISEKTRYRDGYRDDGIYGDELDWYYTSKICNNWYYYEFHDG